MHAKAVRTSGTNQGQYMNPNLVFLASQSPGNSSSRGMEKEPILVVRNPQLLVGMHVWLGHKLPLKVHRQQYDPKGSTNKN